MTDTAGLIERLSEACNGHPAAKIAWPHRLLHEAVATLSSQAAEIARLREALTPSAATKAAYIGEFTIAIERVINEDGEVDDDGEADPYQHVQVPWTTIKQIMAAIRARAALNGEKE